MATGVGEFEHVLLIGTDGVPYSASGGVTVTDSGQFVPTIDSASPVMGLYELAPTTLADNDVGVVAVTANRVLKAALHAADGSAITTLPVSIAAAVTVSGDVAHDSADSGSPVLTGGRAESVSSRAAVATGDRVIASHDTLGRYNVAVGGSNGTAGSDAATTVTVPYQAGVADVNTTRPLIVGAYMYNGTTWDRIRGDTTNGLDVDVTRSALPTGASTLAEQQTQTTALQLIDNGVVVLGTATYTEASSSGYGIAAVRRDADTTLVNTTNEWGPLQMDARGFLKVEAFSGEALAVTTIIPGTAATNLGKAEDAAHTTGDVGVMALGVRSAAPSERSAGPTDGDYEPFATNEVGAVWTSLTPSVNGGLSTFMASGSDGSSILVATAQAVKASAGALYGYYVYNPEAAVTFLHFYNTAAASVTVGTTNPLLSFAIPAGAAANLAFPMGVTFSNAGWSVAATTTAGGNTAPGTGLSLVAWYK